jgi:hypothetical protein
MARDQPVNRPIKKSEYTIRFGSRAAENGWKELLAARRNQLVTVWEYLTINPDLRSEVNYPFKGELGTIVRGGVTYERWQMKLNSRDGFRI